MKVFKGKHSSKTKCDLTFNKGNYLLKAWSSWETGRSPEHLCGGAVQDMAKALLEHLMPHHKCKFWCAKSLNTVMSSYPSKGERVEKMACLVLQELTKVRANPLRERLGGVCHFYARIH